LSEVLARWYSLTINGSEVSDEVKRRITDITLEVKESGSSTLTIKMVDNAMEYLTGSYLVKKAKVSFTCAWYSRRAEYCKFIGYISVLDVDFADLVKLTITCLDESYPMSEEEKTRSWENKKVSEVAREIFMSYGLSAHVDDTDYVEESVSQSKQSDATFMNSLVGKVTHRNFIWYVDGKDAYFVERAMPNLSGKKLGYKTGNGQILSFNPRLTKGKLKIKKSSANINASTGSTTKTTTTATVSDSSTGTNQGTPKGTDNTGTSKKYVNGKWITV